MILVLIVFILLCAAASLAVLRPGIPNLALTVVTGIAWLIADSPVEGPVLFTINHGHGVTAADSLSVIAVAIAVVAYVRFTRRQRARL